MMNTVFHIAAAGLLILGSSFVTAAALTPEQQLGERLLFDVTLSINDNQACSSCHMPTAGFADP
jgi:cytochrome c peroxidase